MCWNAPVSLTAFLTSIILCAYIWHRNKSNDRPLALWISWIALMQLFEFFMWRDMKDHATEAKLSLITTILQPFILAAGLYYYTLKKSDSVWRKPLLFGVMFMSLLQACCATYYAFVTEKNANWLSVKGPNCHLVWWYKKHENRVPLLARVDVIYFITLLISALLITPFKLGMIYVFIGLITISITKLYYPIETSSLWCWMVNILAFITLAMPYIKL